MPNDPDRLDRIEASIEKLTRVVDALASPVVVRDNRIEQLLTLAEKHNQAIAKLERQLQAYLSTIHPKH
jgi:hypothetical protein